MMTCAKCLNVKPEIEFSIKSGKITNQCLACKREYNRAIYAKKSPEAKKDRAVQMKLRYQELRKKLWDYKCTQLCARCGESDPVVLEFDHLDQANKDSEICNMVKNGRSWDSILKEIAKCQVLCANCHRRKTHKQLGWYNQI